jgi:hypothetical protein
MSVVRLGIAFIGSDIVEGVLDVLLTSVELVLVKLLSLNLLTQPLNFGLMSYYHHHL